MKSINSTPYTIGIIAGMPRSGTTFLYYYLSQHPEVFSPPRKEINYYSVYYERGVDWYNNLFNGKPQDHLGIDASPFYYLDKEAVKRLAIDSPSSKVILGIRKPSEMVCAMYERISSSTIAMPSFEEFIDRHEWNIGSGLTIRPKDFPYTDRIIEFQEAFTNQLLLYSFDALNNAPLKVLQQVEMHFGLSEYFTEENFSNHIINASKRRNSKILSYVLKNESLIDFLISTLPRKSINKAREKFLKISQLKDQGTKPPLNPENLKIAKDYLGMEDEKTMKLFKSKDFILGSNSSFDK